MEFRETWRQTGLVEADQHHHAVDPSGDDEVLLKAEQIVALCGAGRIVKRFPGWYQPDDPLACTRCSAQLEATSQPARPSNGDDR